MQKNLVYAFEYIPATQTKKNSRNLIILRAFNPEETAGGGNPPPERERAQISDKGEASSPSPELRCWKGGTPFVCRWHVQRHCEPSRDISKATTDTSGKKKLFPEKNLVFFPSILGWLCGIRVSPTYMQWFFFLLQTNPFLSLFIPAALSQLSHSFFSHFLASNKSSLFRALRWQAIKLWVLTTLFLSPVCLFRGVLWREKVCGDVKRGVWNCLKKSRNFTSNIYFCNRLCFLFILNLIESVKNFRIVEQFLLTGNLVKP